MSYISLGKFCLFPVAQEQLNKACNNTEVSLKTRLLINKFLLHFFLRFLDADHYFSAK